MDETKHGHHADGIQHGHRPYWKHAHRDWRFWVAALFIFAAISIYVMSDDLALVPRSHPGRSQAPSENSGTR